MYFIVGGRRTVINERKSLYVLYGICILYDGYLYATFLSIYVLTRDMHCIVSLRLLFASCCCVIGNIVYALALPHESLQMVLLGRLLTGFGSSRVINRRYIGECERRTCNIVTYLNI